MFAGSSACRVPHWGASESPARPQDDTTRASNLREKLAVAKAPASRPRDTGPALVAARFFVFNSRSEAMHTVNGTTMPGLKFELFRASSLPAGNEQGEPPLPWQPGESHRLPTAGPWPTRRCVPVQVGF